MLLNFNNDWEHNDVVEKGDVDEEEIRQRRDTTSGKQLIKNQSAKVHALGKSVGLL